MKKLFYLLFLLPLAFLASCNNDDDFPQVDLKFTLNGVYQNESTGAFYAVEGDEVNLGGVSATSLTSQAATVTNPMFYVNGNLIVPFPQEDEENDETVFTYGTINQYFVPEKVNFITTYVTILQVDKSIANGKIVVPITVVANAENLPTEVQERGKGDYSVTMRMNPKD